MKRNPSIWVMPVNKVTFDGCNRDPGPLHWDEFRTDLI